MAEEAPIWSALRHQSGVNGVSFPVQRDLDSYKTFVSDSHYQATLDAVYVYLVPWSEFPIVPSYPYYPQSARLIRQVDPARLSRHRAVKHGLTGSVSERVDTALVLRLLHYYQA